MACNLAQVVYGVEVQPYLYPQPCAESQLSYSSAIAYYAFFKLDKAKVENEKKVESGP